MLLNFIFLKTFKYRVVIDLKGGKVKMQKKKATLLICILLLTALGSAIETTSSSSTFLISHNEEHTPTVWTSDTTKQTQTLIYGCAGDADKLDPGDVTDGESTIRTDNIFEGLVEYKPQSTEIQPCLATSWSISPDGKNINFSLRQGVKFHDGTDFNASAVVFSFERQYNTSHPYHQYGEWAYWGYMFTDIERVAKIDNYTINIVLKEPNAAIMTSLAMFTAAIVSPTNAALWKEEAYKHPVGTGPFKFSEWVPNDHITLVANDDYWRGPPKLQKITFQVITNPTERLQELQYNNIQGIEFPDLSSLDIIQSDQNLTLLAEPGCNIGYLAMNNGYGYYDSNHNGVHDPDEPWVQTPGYFEPLTNKLVRQAINYAINKTFIIETIYNQTAITAKNGIPPFMLGYNDAIIDYSYNRSKAKELLTIAGYPNGFNTTLWVMPVSRPYMKNPILVGEAIQEFLAAVNISIDLYQIDWATYLQKTQNGEHSMCLLGWTGDNGDPDNFMNVLYGANQCAIGTGGNVAFYNNSFVQDLFTAALYTYNCSERADLYKEAQVIIHEEAPFVYLAYANQYLVFRENVKGFLMNPIGRLFFYPVELKETPHESKIAFLYGKIQNYTTLDDSIEFEAINLRIITFQPWKMTKYTSGEPVMIEKIHLGFIGKQCIFSFCKLQV
jgi:ABC-type transport system substrate-binding protein